MMRRRALSRGGPAETCAISTAEAQPECRRKPMAESEAMENQRAGRPNYPLPFPKTRRQKAGKPWNENPCRHFTPPRGSCWRWPLKETSRPGKPDRDVFETRLAPEPAKDRKVPIGRPCG